MAGPNNPLDLSSILGGYAGPAAGNAHDPPVYTGQQVGAYNQGNTGEHSGPGGYVRSGGDIPTSAAMTLFAGMPAVEQQALANKLYRAGILDSPDDIQGAYSQWQKAVQFAADAYSAGQTKVTPWDVIQQQIGLGLAAKPKHGPLTTTDTSYNMLAPGDAAAMVKAVYQNELGRDPNAGELSRYTSMIMNKVKGSPDVVVTHNTYDKQGAIIAQTREKTSSAPSQQALAGQLQDRTHADPEYGAYQAATSYMGAIQQLFSGSPDLTGPNG